MGTNSIQTFSLEHKQFCWSGVGARSTEAADPDMQPHRHSFFQIFFVAAGSANHEIGDRVYEAGPGSIFFISPYTVHRVSFPDDAECYVLYFSAHGVHEGFSPSEATAYDEQLLRRPELAPFVYQSRCSYRLDAEDIARARHLCRRIQACCLEKGPYDAAQARAEMVLLLTLVAKKYADTFKALQQDACINSVIDSRVRAALDFIHRNFARSMTLNDVATHVHLTGTYLTHLLKQELGKSFKQILDEARLENSKNLLAYTDHRMQKIAAQSGFIDQAHFAKRFKAYTHLTPGQFRRQHQSALAG
ncbi:MAG: AraC family transcriptional regulator [Polaromonas sp.]|nr:AraC family transcriptional regulator [Polaromonas sp.]